MKQLKPIVEKIDYSIENLNTAIKYWDKSTNKELLSKYPTVYIINDHTKSHYSVYVGETTNIKRRTLEHLNKDSNQGDVWQKFSSSSSSSMYVIGHEYFNKSLTLDIENKLMQYLSSVDGVRHIYNKRTNPQNDYYTANHFEDIFSNIWTQLHQQNQTLFPVESIVRDSAIFKASPFHKLTNEQYLAKRLILDKIINAIKNQKTAQHIMVEGEAGSGKTVLMSSLFFELKNEMLKFAPNHKPNIHLLVNHEQQLLVYQKIAQKLGYNLKQDNIISKPTSFILNHSPNEKVDVIVVDEAHLLLTQGKMSYKGKNHLKDLLERAKVVVTVFDQKQILSREQIWEEDELNQIIENTKKEDNYIQLTNQLRINSDEETIQWIRTLIDSKEVHNIPEDKHGYEIKIFERPDTLYQSIVKKNNHSDYGLSRIISTFD